MISTALMTYIYVTAVLGITDFALGIGLWFDLSINIFVLIVFMSLISKQLSHSSN